MMVFITVKAALKSILSAGAGTNYQAIGGQRQSKAAENIVDLPLVQVFYESGTFPKSAAGFTGEKQHIATYKFELTAVVQSEANLSVITNPDSTEAEIAAAIAAMPSLAEKCDDAWDKAFQDIFQVLMNAINNDLGIAGLEARDIWIDNVQKGQPLPRGESLVLPGNFIMTVTMTETVTGVTGVPGTAFDINTNVKDDQPDQAGSAGKLGGQ